jgi:hypothetical protein
MAVAGGFLLTWINLAVGIIGDEDNPANIMFAGVLATGLIGALIARFRPLGLSRTLVAMAIVQVAAGVTALAAGWGSTGENWPRPVLVLSGFFAALWTLSAWLFRHAARDRVPADAA